MSKSTTIQSRPRSGISLKRSGKHAVRLTTKRRQRHTNGRSAVNRTRKLPSSPLLTLKPKRVYRLAVIADGSILCPESGVDVERAITTLYWYLVQNCPEFVKADATKAWRTQPTLEAVYDYLIGFVNQMKSTTLIWDKNGDVLEFVYDQNPAEMYLVLEWIPLVKGKISQKLYKLVVELITIVCVKANLHCISTRHNDYVLSEWENILKEHFSALDTLDEDDSREFEMAMAERLLYRKGGAAYGLKKEIIALSICYSCGGKVAERNLEAFKKNVKSYGPINGMEEYTIWFWLVECLEHVDHLEPVDKFSHTSFYSSLYIGQDYVDPKTSEDQIFSDGEPLAPSDLVRILWSDKDFAYRVESEGLDAYSNEVGYIDRTAQTRYRFENGVLKVTSQQSIKPCEALAAIMKSGYELYTKNYEKTLETTIYDYKRN